MTAFNTARFRVKAGRDQDFFEAHKSAKLTGPASSTQTR
jgi:hypothetical protein